MGVKISIKSKHERVPVTKAVIDSKKNNNVIDMVKKGEIYRPKEMTELGESLQELNLDKIDKKTRMSSIDLRTRLSESEITGMLIIDTIAGFRVISEETQFFTLRKKRLNVSRQGKGRDDIVNIVQGKQEREGGSRFMNGFKSMFTGRQSGE